MQKNGGRFWNSTEELALYQPRFLALKWYSDDRSWPPALSQEPSRWSGCGQVGHRILRCKKPPDKAPKAIVADQVHSKTAQRPSVDSPTQDHRRPKGLGNKPLGQPQQGLEDQAL